MGSDETVSGGGCTPTQPSRGRRRGPRFLFCFPSAAAVFPQKTAKPFDKININQRELEKVNKFIETHCTSEQKARLESVYSLIEGFESPLGMELLATVDYVINYECGTTLFADLELENKIYSWSKRKKKLIKKEYIDIALERLKEFES